MPPLPEADINSLVIDSIKSYAKLESKVGSLEQSINMLRTENEKILSKISESLQLLAAIQERVVNNDKAHEVIHDRIERAKESIETNRVEIEAVKDIVHGIRRNCASVNHDELIKRIEIVEKHNHDDIVKRLDSIEQHNKVMDTKLDRITNSLRLVSFRLKGIPLWLIILVLVLMGAAFDIDAHKEAFMRFFGLLAK